MATSMLLQRRMTRWLMRTMLPTSFWCWTLASPCCIIFKCCPVDKEDSIKFMILQYDNMRKNIRFLLPVKFVKSNEWNHWQFGCRRSEKFIRFNFWFLFVTKNDILRFFGFQLDKTIALDQTILLESYSFQSVEGGDWDPPSKKLNVLDILRRNFNMRLDSTLVHELKTVPFLWHKIFI